MNFPIVIHREEKGNYIVTVPDLLGCSAKGRNLDEAILNTRETVDLHLARLIDEGYTIPMPSDIELLHHNPDYAEAFFGVVSVDMDKLPTKMVRIHVTIAEHLLKTVDAYAKKYSKSRSGLLTRALLEFFGKH